MGEISGLASSASTQGADMHAWHACILRIEGVKERKE
jgi:hypothetical protein